MEVEGYVAEDRGGGVSLSVSVHLPCTRTNSLDQAAAHASHHLGKSFLQRLLWSFLVHLEAEGADSWGSSSPRAWTLWTAVQTRSHQVQDGLLPINQELRVKVPLESIHLCGFHKQNVSKTHTETHKPACVNTHTNTQKWLHTQRILHTNPQIHTFTCMHTNTHNNMHTEKHNYKYAWVPTNKQTKKGTDVCTQTYKNILNTQTHACTHTHSQNKQNNNTHTVWLLLHDCWFYWWWVWVCTSGWASDSNKTAWILESEEHTQGGMASKQIYALRLEKNLSTEPKIRPRIQNRPSIDLTCTNEALAPSYNTICSVSTKLAAWPSESMPAVRTSRVSVERNHRTEPGLHTYLWRNIWHPPGNSFSWIWGSTQRSSRWCDMASRWWLHHQGQRKASSQSGLRWVCVPLRAVGFKPRQNAKKGYIHGRQAEQTCGAVRGKDKRWSKNKHWGDEEEQ